VTLSLRFISDAVKVRLLTWAAYLFVMVLNEEEAGSVDLGFGDPNLTFLTIP